MKHLKKYEREFLRDMVTIGPNASIWYILQNAEEIWNGTEKHVELKYYFALVDTGYGRRIVGHNELEGAQKRKMKRSIKDYIRAKRANTILA